MKNVFKKLFLCLTLVAVLFTAVACGGTKKRPGEGVYTYNDYTAVSPSNWNELTYQDNNDTQIMSYIGSSFFTYDFLFENGQVVPGKFVTKYSAATNLRDVTSEYVGEEWGIPADATQRAYEITLRNDLKWENGDPIKAEDFVYSMEAQLDPEFQNYRADSYYVGQTIIHNAENYVKQGQTIPVDSRKFHDTFESAKADPEVVFDIENAGFGAFCRANYNSYIQAYGYNWMVTSGFGLGVNDDQLNALKGKNFAQISADADLLAAWNALIGAWKTMPEEELDFFAKSYTYPAVSFDKVGIKADGDYKIVLILDKPIKLLEEDGSLNYNCAYAFSGLPLVHKATYEACIVEPSEGNPLYTSTYNSDVDSTMSWGPYKLQSFQVDKEYVLVRNELWYGYNMPENEGLYQADKIVCETIKEWQTAWIKFLSGEIDGIGIDVSVADEYKGSERAYFTPDDYVGSMQLQSDYSSLKKRGDEDGVNKTILTYTEFRKALSLGIDREDYNRVCTTSSKAGFGLFNSMHYYDVENGGVFRNTDEARKVLCEVYSVDWTKFEGATDSEKLVAAEKSITGLNVTEAKKLIDEAVDKAVADGEYTIGQKVVLTIGTSVKTESSERQFNYLANNYRELAKGTKLEGLLDFEFEVFGDAWANDFRAGAYDICTGGWTGAAWDPGYFLLAYLGDSNRYARAWDPRGVKMTFTMEGVGENGEDITETMNLLEWYDCLNGATTAKYDWSATALPQSKRLGLIAALEGEVLKTYYCVPIQNYFSASLLSYKLDYITYEYNTFMGYGGIKYATFNYDDADWADFVAENNNEINYK